MHHICAMTPPSYMLETAKWIQWWSSEYCWPEWDMNKKSILLARSVSSQACASILAPPFRLCHTKFEAYSFKTDRVLLIEAAQTASLHFCWSITLAMYACLISIRVSLIPLFASHWNSLIKWHNSSLKRRQSSFWVRKKKKPLHLKNLGAQLLQDYWSSLDTSFPTLWRVGVRKSAMADDDCSSRSCSNAWLGASSWISLAFWMMGEKTDVLLLLVSSGNGRKWVYQESKDTLKWLPRSTGWQHLD